MDSLPDRQPQVIRMRYHEGKNLKEAGTVMGVTLERVRTIVKTALHKLRTSGKARKLYPFLPEYVEGMAYRHNDIGEFSRTWTSSTERAALKIYGEITGHALH